MTNDEKRQAIISELTVSYWMELETVLNYLANSVNLDGVRAERGDVFRAIGLRTGRTQDFPLTCFRESGF